MKEKIYSKYGTLQLDDLGYYRIVSVKEGNFNKRLHQLILKPLIDYLKYKFPEIKWDIHHKDGNKLNNEFVNLQIIPSILHTSIHMKGKSHNLGYKHTSESKENMSNSKINIRNNNKGVFGGTGASLKKSVNPEAKPWICKVGYNKRKKHIGYFHDFLTCEIIYKLIIEEINKEYAKLV